VCGNLRGSRSVYPHLAEMVFDLFAARAAGLQIFFRIALNLRLSVLAALKLVTQPLQPHRQLGTVNASGMALRGK